MNDRPSPVNINTGSGTRDQVNTLLGITNSLMQHLYDGNSEELDPAARKAALSTVQNACLRLDIILKENDRWPGNDQTRDRAHSLLEAQQRYLEAQTQASVAVARPSVRLRANLEAANNGWLCWYGELAETRLEAWGPSPEEAMEAFDIAFTERNIVDEN